MHQARGKNKVTNCQASISAISRSLKVVSISNLKSFTVKPRLFDNQYYPKYFYGPYVFSVKKNAGYTNWILRIPCVIQIHYSVPIIKYAHIFTPIIRDRQLTIAF